MSDDLKARLREHAVQDRFWRFVEKTDDCWNWTGRMTPNGYGRFTICGKQPAAHRIAVMMDGRDIPQGMVADHVCRNRACVRPDHIRIVTHQVNTTENSRSIQAQNAAKTHCVNGHEFTPANTLHHGGWRRCRECQRERCSAHYSRLKEHNRERERA